MVQILDEKPVQHADDNPVRNCDENQISKCDEIQNLDSKRTESAVYVYSPLQKIINIKQEQS